MHAESAVRALHEQQRQHREDVIHAAAIRAALCAARGLPMSTGCLLAGLPLPAFAQGLACPALGAFSGDVMAAARRLLAALDRLDDGCEEPGFRGWRNGHGEDVGDEVQDARESLAAICDKGMRP